MIFRKSAAAFTLQEFQRKLQARNKTSRGVNDGLLERRERMAHAFQDGL
jgi:hypothetical protein